ncbi:MAG: biotin--[acetyl-CoA-carboxylase] ligase [Erysipelotrichaceae bacterium]|jgi:BirA family biotin operon repressor/biotin-[acetyl-CoA-carboxylase] ligase
MKLIHFEEIDSTNTFLKNNYQNYQHLTFVSADNQTAGRGREDKRWFSEKGKNLLFSVLIKDDKLIENYKAISIICGYSVLEVLKDYGLEKISIKWPNDVYADGKKICGVLLEAVSRKKIECLIAGIGINVNQREFSKECIVTPTSLRNQSGKAVDLNKFKRDIYSKLISNFRLVKQDYDFYKHVQQYDYLKDKEVYALVSNEKKLVKVTGINSDYSLGIIAEDKKADLETGEISFSLL